MKNLPTILLVIILTLGTAITGRAWWNGHLESEALQKYNRQLKGELAAKEKEMQSLNLQLNVLNAELLSSESLKDDHDKILKALGLRDSEFAKFRKKHKLEIESYTETIFNLKRQITEGSNQTTVVVVNDDGTTEPFDPSKHLKPNQKINYEYKDVYGTVHLYDPDIATSGDEVLTLNQQFKIFGEIYRETNGNLKTQRLTLEEIHKTENGEVIVLRKLELDEEQAQFKYTIEPPASDDHFFEFNLIANVGYNFNDGVVGLGATIFKLDWDKQRFFLATGFHSSLNSIDTAGFNLKMLYRPYIIHKYANFGIGAGISFPFNDLRKPQALIDLNFFIW